MGQMPASAVDTGTPVEWGVRRTMTDFKAVMWWMEADPDCGPRRRWRRSSTHPGSCPAPGCAWWNSREDSEPR